MNFDAPWDKTLKVTTTLALALLVAVTLIPPYRPEWVLLLKTATLLGVTGLTWMWAPTGYRVEGDQLIVRRNAGEKRIPLQGLKAARLLSKRDLCGSIRTFGSGGLFGYFGKFYSTSLGSQTWYVTDRSRVVLLDTAAGKYLVSPDNPEALLYSVQVFLPAKV
jgi:hypothetical protein